MFDKEPFKAEAPKQFVLVELDFPHEKEQSDDLKKQNKELAEKYNVEGFPTVLLLDAEGQVIARTGYREGGPEEYLKQLAELPKIYQNVLALKAKLDKTQGLDRAKLLDEIVEGYEKLGNESEEVAAWSKEIIALDPDNKAGLKVKYEFPLTLDEAMKLLQDGKSRRGQGSARQGPGVEGRSRGIAAGRLHGQSPDLPSRKRSSSMSWPRSSWPRRPRPRARWPSGLTALIEQFSKVAEAQEAADKLEAGLAKSEGTDRAKLLDKLIDAKQKLLRYDPEAGENINKWTKEIIALDRRQQGRPEEEVSVQGGLGRRRRVDASGQGRRSQRRAGQGPGDRRHFRRRGPAGPVPQGPAGLHAAP